ncbi:Uma2 family endonuclease [Nocardia suismassiliense]|uniref:Uma2 family endonuclease n=1 Tax=Nocardia suismassiliense TaxID=2077092 RepID=A0ABW6QU74_9NOCA
MDTDEDVTVAEFERLELAASEEVTVELINGRVYVAPMADGEHSEFISQVDEQIRAYRPELRLFHSPGLTIPADRACRARPDGAIAPSGYFRTQPPWADPAGVAMLVEVTAGRESDADIDRTEKRDAYAQALMPAYLLVDRHRAASTIHWHPADGSYRNTATAVFGCGLRLPPPFDFELDTSVFR